MQNLCKLYVFSLEAFSIRGQGKQPVPAPKGERG